MNISKDISIEELVESCPDAVIFLREHGIRCILCGEPTWGTLGQAAAEKGFDEGAINDIVAALRRLCQSRA